MVVGDSIEFLALRNAFGERPERAGPCSLGSVKSNLGHLEAASGMSQLSKVILQLRHRTLAPTINADPLNPTIQFEGSPFVLQRTASAWEAIPDPLTGRPLPRRAMINSFGAGGTYANLIVEEFIDSRPAPATEGTTQPGELLVFSARTEWSLRATLQRFTAFIRDNPTLGLTQLAQTLQSINPDLPRRAALMAHSPSYALTELERRLLPGPTSIAKDLPELAQLWLAGESVDFEQLQQGRPAHVCLRLPKYPFDHEDQHGSSPEALLAAVESAQLTEAEFVQLLSN